MRVWEWVSNFLPMRREPPPIEAAEARETARRIGELSDQLNAHLQKYHRASDPFAAMMADLYNRDQVSRVHLGPPS